MPEAHDIGQFGPLGDDGVETRWMTYGELSELREISVASARALAYRHRWRRQPGNDGTTRIEVPLHEARRRRDDDQVGANGRSSLVKSLEAAMLTLGLQLDRERNRADEAEAQLVKLEHQAAKLQATTELAVLARKSLERALTVAEADIARIEGEFAVLQIAAKDAEAKVVSLRDAEQERREQSRLIRLKVAWRGA